MRLQNLLPLTILLTPIACGIATPPEDPAHLSEEAKTHDLTPKPKPKPLPPVQTVKVTANPELLAMLSAPDRADADKALDAGRRPAEMLTFFGIQKGMRVAELGAGGGYTAEILARAVGPEGKVYGQNTQSILDKFAQKPWSERLQKPINKNVVSVVREFDDPLPPDAQNLDAVLVILFYHDTVWLKVDREKMNQSIFRALKKGGVYGIIDHSAKPGTGASETQTTHRIEERVIREEVTHAGFRLEAEADFLKNPSDPRNWSTSPSAAGEKRGTSDRFVLKFVKP